MNMDKTVFAIVGTGMMASGLGTLTAGHGYKTYILARKMERAEACEKVIYDNFMQMVAHGLMEQEQLEQCMGYLVFTTDYSEMADAQMAFECVSEAKDMKYSVYQLLEEYCPDLKAIGSVSSSIVPNELIKGAGKYANRILVTHPFNPPYLVPFFEMCAADKTDPSVVIYVKDILLALDRKPVVLKKPTPGFIGNRLQFALWRECLALVEEGVCMPEDVDACLAYSFCPRYTSIGIFQHFDQGGLELNAVVCRNTWPVLSSRTEIPEFMKDLMEKGYMGAKSPSKRGFYDWNGVDMKAYAEKVSEPYWKFCNWDFLRKESE